MLKESDSVEKGMSILSPFETAVGRVGLMICFDVRVVLLSVSISYALCSPLQAVSSHLHPPCFIYPQSSHLVLEIPKPYSQNTQFPWPASPEGLIMQVLNVLL